MILAGRMLPLLILLLILLQLIDLHLLLAHGQNPVGAIILMNNWLTYSANSLILLILIRLPVLILMQGELKPTSLTLSVALSLIQHGHCENQLCNNLPHWSSPGLVWDGLQPERPGHPSRLALWLEPICGWAMLTLWSLGPHWWSS